MTNVKPLSPAELEDLLPRLRATVELAQIVAGPLERYMAYVKPNGRSVPVAKKAPSRTTRKQPQQKTTKRPSGVALQNRVHEFLKTESKGAQVAAIAKAIGVESEPVRYALGKLRDEKRARMIGKLGQAKWHAVA